jgi:hypothetical protein
MATKNQRLRELDELRARLQHQIDLEATIPPERIGRDADVLPLHLKLRLIDSYLIAGLTAVESLDELPSLTAEEKREIMRYLVMDQYGEDIDDASQSP